MFRKGLNGIIIGLSSLSALIWVLSLITPLEISNLLFRKLIVFTSLAGAVYILICRIMLKDYKNLRFTVSMILFLILGIVIYRYNCKPDWKTSKVHFVNNHFGNSSIETQTQYLGEWNYNYRLVKKTRVSKFIWIVQNADTSKLDSDWIRIKKEYRIKIKN